MKISTSDAQDHTTPPAVVQCANGPVDCHWPAAGGYPRHYL